MTIHPLFTAPAAEVDLPMLQSFLDLDLEESLTLDYKRNIEASAETIAAMANTYGGIVLIGVDPRRTGSSDTTGSRGVPELAGRGRTGG